MATSYPYSENELEVKDRFFGAGFEVEVFDSPITMGQNMRDTIRNHPVWQGSVNDYQYLAPLCIPDNIARGSMSADTPPDFDLANYGGKDMFGREWVYEADIMGSTVRPGDPVLDDANDWPEVIKFPTKEEIDSWDWETHAQAAKDLRQDQYTEIIMTTGFFERLISFMDFEEAVIAMIDEDQQEAVKALFDRLADLYVYLIDKQVETYGDVLDAICLHDDWGHQSGPFFSLDTVREMVVPYMRRVTDRIHSYGLDAEVHSCGKVDELIPGYIEAGFDAHECQPVLDFDEVVPLYGDRIKFHVPPREVTDETQGEAFEQAARDYVERILAYGNPVIMETFYSPALSLGFYRELYRSSRMQYADAHWKGEPRC